jgi:hypothetical protein
MAKGAHVGSVEEDITVTVKNTVDLVALGFLILHFTAKN